MDKFLKSYTTIPEHLYVCRSADTQLKRIITDMQRPGYVLVARQMGKTNLLFNAKRTLESESRLFVYVDLSNLYNNERDCYRNIINNITEPNVDYFEGIANEIENIRAHTLTPHNEYSRCLRAILRHFSGDIVIVLDEIDALKSVDYSDNIFAQIRSNYFSRTNFPEFERLTYVLSGVIEPTELIKDRNKSPFNIGDKIYLDDFTKDEHDDFIIKSKLNINEELSNEIFKLARGNPRLTFDICSELEDVIIDGTEINTTVLDYIVKRKYLTTFDIAPIDHIRELVKTNSEIRKAVTLIHRNKSSELSDDIKRKLYLYGIINSKFDEEIKIKNEIIRQCLSEEWIKSIDRQEATLVKGVVKYDNQEYSDAIEIFTELLVDPPSSPVELENIHFFLGKSYYRLHQFQNALEYFSKGYSSESYRVDAKLYLGICKLATGAKDEGISILSESTQHATNNNAYFNALLNLGINVDDKAKSADIMKQVYQSTFKPANGVTESELNEFRTLSLYYQAQLFYRDSQDNEALVIVDEALKSANKSLLLYLLFFKYQLEAEKDESLKKRLVDELIDNNLGFDRKNYYPISFSESLLYTYLGFVFDEANPTLFERLLDYAITNLLPASNKYQVIYDAAFTRPLVRVESMGYRLGLLKYLIQFEQDVEDELLLNAYRYLAQVHANDKGEYHELFDKYLQLFANTDIVTASDIYLFAMSCKFAYEQDNKIEVIQLCKSIEPRFSNIEDENIKLESAVIYYWLALANFAIKERLNARKYADIGLEIISSSKSKSASIIGEKGLAAISEQLNDIKHLSILKQPVVNTRKYGRNERVKVRYSDGREVEMKYKHVEADLLTNQCKIID